MPLSYLYSSKCNSMASVIRTYALVSMLFILSMTVYGQVRLNEATLSYQIAIQNPDGGAMGSATLTVYVKGNLSRTDMVSSLGKESAIFDQKLGKGVILKEYSGQKLMITMTQENWNKKNQVFHDLLFTSSAKPEQAVAGFQCRSAEARTKDGKLVTVCFLPDKQLNNTQYNNAFSHLGGIPVQYELESGKLTFRYTLNTLSDEPVPAALFEFPKSGYRVMNFEESQQLKKIGN